VGGCLFVVWECGGCGGDDLREEDLFEFEGGLEGRDEGREGGREGDCVSLWVIEEGRGGENKGREEWRGGEKAGMTHRDGDLKKQEQN